MCFNDLSQSLVMHLLFDADNFDGSKTHLSSLKSPLIFVTTAL